MKSTTGDTGELLPAKWFNLLSALPEPVPTALEPSDDHGSRLDLMRRIRPSHLQEQDHLTTPWVEIPQEILARYEEIGRPTRLTRARNVEKYLGTPARIFVKREDQLPTGSFKLNSAVAQMFYVHREGSAQVVTETGAGQWGHAVAYSARMFDVDSVIFWADVSARQKPEREAILRMLGATVYPSPSGATEVGRTLAARGGSGSLGTAIGEAICYARDVDGFRYLSGSNHPHVLMHQTVIGLEVKRQMERLGEEPTVLIACVGGGGNLGGLIGPFIAERRRPESTLRFLGAEAASAPRLTRGEFRYDHADPLGLTPLSKSYTLGRDYALPEMHAGGLRQHSGSPIIGVLRSHGLVDAVAYTEQEVFETGCLFLRLEGIVAAPEACHALRAAVDAATEARSTGRAENIVVCMSGSGLLDMSGYLAHGRTQERAA